MPRYSVVALDWKDQDLLRVSLNDSLEFAICEILREHPKISKKVFKWKKAMALTVPSGYDTYPETLDYIRRNLLSTSKDVFLAKDEEIGNESDLLKLMHGLEPELVQGYNYKPVFSKRKFSISLDLIRKRKDIIGLFRNKKYLEDDGNKKDEKKQKEQEKIPPVLLYKIYYTYKLWETLEAAVGYYNGSLEFRAGAHQDYEYWSYLLQLKLRNPCRNYPFAAPKSMMEYKTCPGSVLPYNNQFSFSYGFDEFDADSMPDYAKIFFQGALLKTVFDDAVWDDLMMLLGWYTEEVKVKKGKGLSQVAVMRNSLQRHYKKPVEIDKIIAKYLQSAISEAQKSYNDMDDDIDNMDDDKDEETSYQTLEKEVKKLYKTDVYNDFDFSLTIDNVLSFIKAEIDLKAFFALVLRLPWSKELLPAKHNIFAEMLEQVRNTKHANRINRLLQTTVVKDARVNAIQAATPLERLADAKYVFNCIGRSANILVPPEEAGVEFKKKLTRMTQGQREIVYDNIIEQLKLNKGFKVDEVVDQAVKAANIWLATAAKNKKPIYTGPSGHALTYISLYLHALKDQGKKFSGVDDNYNDELDVDDEQYQKNFSKEVDYYPNLDECRLVVLAGLIGHNQHHSYDEVMTGCHGVRFLAGDGKENNADKDKDDDDKENIEVFEINYTDQVGYKDMMKIPGHPEISGEIKRAASAIALKELRRFDEATDLIKGEGKEVDAPDFQKIKGGKVKLKHVDTKTSEWYEKAGKWYRQEVLAWYQDATGDKLNEKELRDKGGDYNDDF